MKIAFYTLGCKVNQYETDLLINEFLSRGFTLVDCDEVADVYVINSCTVTSNSDKKTRQVINKFKRLNPKSKLVLLGCFVQAFPEKATLIDKVDIVIGTKNKSEVVKAVNDIFLAKGKIVSIRPHLKSDAFEKAKVKSFSHNTRAFIKIQDGCNRYCSYCIIPYARGFSRSKPLEELSDEINDLALNGYKEIVLVGINLSSYGQDLGTNLLEAVQIACKQKGIQRVRLGSLEPEFLTEDILLKLSECEKFCPHFHISLQSGCDGTLKRMNRHYTTDEYKQIVTNIRKYFHNPSITTDLMVGFAGETDEEFLTTLKFLHEIKFSKIHIFPYSKREGTKAYELDGHIETDVKNNRCKRVAVIEKKLHTEFIKNMVGRVESVLFESTITNQGQEGHTKNYTTVFVKSEENLQNTIKNVRITHIEDSNCIGEIIN